MKVVIENINVNNLYKKYVEFYEDRNLSLDYAQSFDSVERGLKKRGYVGFIDRVTRNRNRFIFVLKK